MTEHVPLAEKSPYQKRSTSCRKVYGTSISDNGSKVDEEKDEMWQPEDISLTTSNHHKSLWNSEAGEDISDENNSDSGVEDQDEDSTEGDLMCESNNYNDDIVHTLRPRLDCEEKVEISLALDSSSLDKFDNEIEEYREGSILTQDHHTPIKGRRKITKLKKDNKQEKELLNSSNALNQTSGSESEQADKDLEFPKDLQNALDSGGEKVLQAKDGEIGDVKNDVDTKAIYDNTSLIEAELDEKDKPISISRDEAINLTPKLSIEKKTPFISELQKEAGSDFLTQTTTTDEQPDDDDLIFSIDNLFVLADMDTVTVKDIVVALEAEYSVTLSKKSKAFVRDRLMNLVEGTAVPTATGGKDLDDESLEATADEDHRGYIGIRG
jgi:DEK C terminal domain